MDDKMKSVVKSTKKRIRRTTKCINVIDEEQNVLKKTYISNVYALTHFLFLSLAEKKLSKKYIGKQRLKEKIQTITH